MQAAQKTHRGHRVHTSGLDYDIKIKSQRILNVTIVQ